MPSWLTWIIKTLGRAVAAIETVMRWAYVHPVAGALIGFGLRLVGDYLLTSPYWGVRAIGTLMGGLSYSMAIAIGGRVGVELGMQGWVRFKDWFLGAPRTGPVTPPTGGPREWLEEWIRTGGPSMG